MMSGFKKMTLPEARACVKVFNDMSDEEFNAQVQSWRKHEVAPFDRRYENLRTVLLDSFHAAGGDDPQFATKYQVDVEVGLALFDYLRPESRGGLLMDLVSASDNDVWRYISVGVFPDLTYLRYPNPEKKALEEGERINAKRFYSHTRRIWLKTLWWYVFLSWQGGVDETREVIKDNGANIISHFIETPGRGYRVDLYRSLMKTYAHLDKKNDALFSAAAKLNGAKCRTIEPGLCLGGVDAYSENLFREVSQRSVG